MADPLLEEQLDYYRARAPEYDESVYHAAGPASLEGPDADLARELATAARRLRSLAPFGVALELACGTGIWTEVLAPLSQSLTALDGSSEMLALARARVGRERVTFQQVDLFAWEPQRQYDLVFFSMWLSHVPPASLDPFLDRVARAVRPGGRVFIVDEPAGGRQLSGPVEAGMYQTRTLRDGRQYRIVKVYYDPVEVANSLRLRQFRELEAVDGTTVFSLTGVKK